MTRTVENDYPTREHAVERIVRIRTAEGDYVALADDGALTVAGREQAATFAIYRSAYLTASASPDLELDGAQATSFAIRSVTGGKYLTIQNYGTEPGQPYYTKRGLTFIVTASAPDIYWNERFTIDERPDGSSVIASHGDDLRDEPNCSAFSMRVTLSGAYLDYGNYGFQRLFLEDADAAETAAAKRALASFETAAAPCTFVHPGVNVTAEQLTAMRGHIQAHEDPWYADYHRLVNTVPNDMSNEHYVSHFREGVGRGEPAGSGHIGDWEMSCAAAYFNALRWAATGEDRYADTVARIVDGWSRTLKVIDGRDRILGASLATVKLINAAEIIHYYEGGYAGLSDEAFARFQTMLRNVIYPVVRDGGAPMNANGNWDVAPMTTLLAIGVATDDPAIFERGIAMYQSPYCNGSIVNYLTDWGQSVESARDQAHGQLGIGAMGDTCQIAENQGVDLWGLEDNRLAKAYEWCARYNLFSGEGELKAVPLTGVFGYFDDISYWDHMEEQGVYRGQLRPIYETALAHYRTVPGVDMTWAERAARAMRPEGLVHFDNLNFSTLTCYNGPDEPRTEPLVTLRTQLEPWYQHTWAAIRAAGDVPSNALTDGMVPAGLETETTPSYFTIAPDDRLQVTAKRAGAVVLRLIDNGDGTYALVAADNSRVLTVGERLADGGRTLRMMPLDVGDRFVLPASARFRLHNWGIGPMYLSHDGLLVETVIEPDAATGTGNDDTDFGTPTLRLGTTPETTNTATSVGNWLLFIYRNADTD